MTTETENVAALEPPPAVVKQASVGDLLNTMPMKRWLLAGKRLGLTSQEIMEDPAASMVAAAVEKAGREDGNFDQYQRFLDLGMLAMSEFLGMASGEGGADKSGPDGPGSSDPS